MRAKGSKEAKARIVLHDMAHGGDAVGRHEGKVLFVPLGLPGETVDVTWSERGKSYAHASLTRVVKASPHRVTPPCPYFGRCGGCQWQHADYASQLDHKEHIVRTQMVRIGQQRAPDVRPTLGMQDPWRYRNHVQLRSDLKGRLGYYALKSHTVVPVASCLIAHPLVESMWQVLERLDTPARRVVLRAGIRSGDRLAIVEGTSERPPSGSNGLPYSCVYVTPSGKKQLVSGHPHLCESIAGRSFLIESDSFFQNNTLQAEKLVEIVQRYLALKPNETLLDAYCGVGLFALTIAPSTVRLLGIDTSRSAIRSARRNAGERGTFLQGTIAQVLAQQAPRVDAIVLDPPRAGCSEEAIKALSSCGASRIAYVSCDPATLARDVRRLDALGYRLQQVQPVDLFPQTYHIECVALLQQR